MTSKYWRVIDTSRNLLTEYGQNMYSFSIYQHMY